MNILIVDNESDSLAEIEYYVKKYGGFHSYITCNNALEALQQAAIFPIDIAFLEIKMPEINGLELARRLSSLSPDIAIGFVTANNDYAVEAFDVNALDYILKPVREERLFKALDKLTSARLGRHHSNIRESGLTINMFRKFTVRVDGQLIKWNRKKSAELLAYLLENKEQPVRKELLCELFWPDFEPKKALMNLQIIIHSIRKVLGSHDNGFIRIDYSGDHYSLHLKDIKSDVDEFESLLQKTAVIKDPAVLEQAVGLYTGDYLEEEGWLWAEPKKVMLRRKYLSALQQVKEIKRTKYSDKTYYSKII